MYQSCLFIRNSSLYLGIIRIVLNILVIDGMGGGIGKAVVEFLKPEYAEYITAIGTNALATSAMLKAGASRGATGENAVIYNCKSADIIIGPIGIVLADSMLGEISPAIAVAIAASPAQKILIPVQNCNAAVVGLSGKPLAQHYEEIVTIIKNSQGQSA